VQTLLIAGDNMTASHPSPQLPTTAPFAAEDIKTLNAIVARTTPLQRSWLAGFLAGVEASSGVAAVAPAAAARPRSPLTILYATESGNTEALAMKAKKTAQKLGFDARVVDMADIEPSALAKLKNLVVMASTWGEGDPPQRAGDFYNALMGDGAPRLDGVKFAVLALGDTAYVNFCQTGRVIDERLAALGGLRVSARVDLDLDYAKAAGHWIDAVLVELAPAEAAAKVVHVDFKHAHTTEVDASEPAFDAEHPFVAEVSAVVNLNGTGSTRETMHVEFATENDGFSYLPGDAIGVVPENDPRVVADVLEQVGLAGDAALAAKLTTGFEVTTLTRPVVDAYAKLTGRKDVAALLEGDALTKFANDRQIADLFQAFPEKLSAEQLTKLLRPLPARLYSVASSLAAHPGETHLLVGAVRWQSHGRERGGVASTFLADRRKAGTEVKLYVKPNKHFRLPTDNARPIIMIGAGTGVAPFRAFTEERAQASGRLGKSWLIFGERNYTYDFLYQLEWQDHLKAGSLTNLDVAFSRDQPEKIYVQTKLWQQRDQLTRWVEDGAHIYVCGDEKGMAKDVDATLVKILAGGKDLDVGKARLKELAKSGRYQRDVY
jgi:sulfite reductase (NADPH) flavoprotein alpha-component